MKFRPHVPAPRLLPAVRLAVLAALAAVALVLAPVAVAESGGWIVLPQPLDPAVGGSFKLIVARGERGANEEPLASLGNSALQVLWNDGRLWMPADTEPRIDTPVRGLYLVASATGEVVSGHSAKTFVPVGGPRDGQQIWRSRLGHRLELVPGVDPLAPRPGGRLPLFAYFEGRPLAEAIVTAVPRGGSLRDYRRGTTDAVGAATLELDRGGWWLVRVMHMTPEGKIIGASMALPPAAGR